MLFANGKIPTSRINSIATNVLARFPMPNVPGDLNSGTNNYYSQIARAPDGDNYAVRIDPTFDKHRFFVRWSQNQGNPNMDPTPFDIGGKGVGEMVGNNRAQTSIGVSDTITLSPTMIVTAPGGLTLAGPRRAITLSFDRDNPGLLQQFASQQQQTIFPNFGVSGYATMGAGESQWFEHTNTYSFNVGVTKIHGSHNMKFGLQGQIKQNNSIPGSPHAGGAFTFDQRLYPADPLYGG